MLNAVERPVITVRDRLSSRLLEDVGVTREIQASASSSTNKLLLRLWSQP